MIILTGPQLITADSVDLLPVRQDCCKTFVHVAHIYASQIL